MANYTEDQLNNFLETAQDYLRQQQMMNEFYQALGVLSLIVIFLLLLIYAFKKQALPYKKDKILLGFFFIIIPILGGIIYLIFKILTRKEVPSE
jgi:ATP/ADP translocase